MVYKYFVKNYSGGTVTRATKSAIKSEVMSNQQSAEELDKSIIRKFEKRKVYLSFKHNIWGADLEDMQSTSKFIKGICFYYVSLIFIVNIHGLFL